MHYNNDALSTLCLRLATQEEAAVDLLANEPERAACLEAEPVEEARQEFLEGEAARSRIERRQRQQVGMQLAANLGMRKLLESAQRNSGKCFRSEGHKPG